MFNLSREEKRPVTLDEARRLLIDAGFRPNGDQWIVAEQELGLLDPSEVLELVPIKNPPEAEFND
jgi:hypothetical protein